MRVLITGASGHIGSAVVPEILEAGHEVIGLARSDASAEAVRALGAQVRRGDLDDLDGLRAAAADSDAVIHLAYDHAAVHVGDLDGAAATDLAVVAAFGDALAGTGRPFIGIGMVGGGPSAEANPRSAVARAVVGLVQRDIRAVLVAIPPVVHSERDRSGFLPTLIRIARDTKVSGYVGDGANRWPAAHVLDVGRLYRLALDAAPAGAQLCAAAEDGVTVREIAEVIGRHLGVPAVSIPAERSAEHFQGFPFMTFDVTMSSADTRHLLGWKPVRPGVLADLELGHYFAAK